jgi:hypothetical protein
MPVANSGNILFSSLIGRAEGTAGTSPSFGTAGRKFLVEPTGVITLGKTWELGAERSVSLRNPIVATTATLVSNEPELSVSVPAISVGELPIWLSMMGSATVTAGTPNRWDFNPTMGTGSNGPTSFSFISADAVGGTAAGGNAYLLNYCLPTEITISADRSSLTSLSANLFAQDVAATTAVPAASTVVPTSPFMSGRLWNVSLGTALGTASTFTAYNYVLDFNLTINTGIQRQAYLAGTSTMVTHAESGAFGGEITLTIQSNKAANDAFVLGTQEFIKLSWTDGTYGVDIYASFITSDIQPIAGSEDGLTTMTLTGTLAYDPVSAGTIRIVVRSDTAALP